MIGEPFSCEPINLDLLSQVKVTVAGELYPVFSHPFGADRRNLVSLCDGQAKILTKVPLPYIATTRFVYHKVLNTVVLSLRKRRQGHIQNIGHEHILFVV